MDPIFYIIGCILLLIAYIPFNSAKNNGSFKQNACMVIVICVLELGTFVYIHKTMGVAVDPETPVLIYFACIIFNLLASALGAWWSCWIKELLSLEKKLEDLIEKEEFTEAIVVRDKIKKYEKIIKKLDNKRNLYREKIPENSNLINKFKND